MITTATRAQEFRERLRPFGLQKYIGVPVCILRKSDGQSWWAIIRGVESDKVSTDYGGWFKLSEYGETWTVKYLPLSELPKEGAT